MTCSITWAPAYGQSGALAHISYLIASCWGKRCQSVELLPALKILSRVLGESLRHPPRISMFTCPNCSADRSRVLPVDPCPDCGALLQAPEEKSAKSDAPKFPKDEDEIKTLVADEDNQKAAERAQSDRADTLGEDVEAFDGAATVACDGEEAALP